MDKKRYTPRPQRPAVPVPEAEPVAPQRLHWQPGALLAPVPPALVACQAGEAVNVLTVGWTGILSTKPPKTYISVRPQRHSYNIIRQSGCFTVNLPTADMVRTVDLCGVKSGRDTDKLALCKLDTLPAQAVAAPILAACPVSLECKVQRVVPMGSHDMFVADIVSVAVDPAFVDRAGRLMIERCNLLAYAHGTYFALGQALGSFGFSVRKASRGRNAPAKRHKRRP